MPTPINLLSAVGFLVRDPAGSPRVLGTCFAYRQRRFLLGAAHCTRHGHDDLWAVLPASGSRRAHRVIAVEVHPTADLAILTVPSLDALALDPFWDVVNPMGLGELAEGFGYPEDVYPNDMLGPLPRVFRGHYQRLFVHHSSSGYKYRAGELSFPAPSGLSGGPVYRPEAPPMVSGLVAENFESTTLLHAVLDLLVNGIVGGHASAPSQVDVWHPFSVEWSSGNAVTATITIIERNRALSGNDFGLDDLSCGLCGPVPVARRSWGATKASYC